MIIYPRHFDKGNHGPAPLKKRSEISIADRWKLEDIYPNRETWQADFERVQKMMPEITAFDGKLGTTKSTLECLKLTDTIGCLAEKLYVYAHLKLDENTADTDNQGPVNMIDQLSVRLSEAMSFIEPGLLALPEETLKGYIAAPDLALYRFVLEEILRKKPHTLPKEQQALLAQAGIMADAPQTIYSMLNDADMKFPLIKDEKGNDVQVTHGRYYQFLENRDRRVRKDAFDAMYGTYRNQQYTIASIMNAQVQKNLFYVRALKYDSALSMALFDDNIPREVYTRLIDSVHDGLPVFQRYLSLRKRALRLDELRMFDLSAPLVPDFDWKISYAEAIEIITDALAPLGDEYLGVVRAAWRQRWIDVYENEGKRSGAYSWSTYRVHPCILLNHQDTLNDMFTIAHEMGHAMHSYFSHRAQEYRYAHYAIFVAEIASTLNEALLLHHLLKTTNDPKKKAYLLTHHADNFRGTVFVQTLFAEFELRIHEMAEQGKPLTVDALNEVFRGLHERYYGPAVALDPVIGIGWMRIPHFYSSFYVYKYATGFSAANSFCRRILDEGASAVVKYLGLLKSGGKDYPLNLLKTAGLDMTTPSPVSDALSAFETTVAELEKLL